MLSRVFPPSPALAGAAVVGCALGAWSVPASLAAVSFVADDRLVSVQVSAASVGQTDTPPAIQLFPPIPGGSWDTGTTVAQSATTAGASASGSALLESELSISTGGNLSISLKQAAQAQADVDANSGGLNSSAIARSIFDMTFAVTPGDSIVLSSVLEGRAMFRLVDAVSNQELFSGAGPYASVLSTTRIRVYSAIDLDTSAPPSSGRGGSAGLSLNITAVPTPASGVLLAALGLGLRRRRA